MVLALAFALVAAAVPFAGGEEETAAASAEPRDMVEDPTTGKMLLAPRYGGSISYAAVGSPPSSDTWFTHHSNNAINGVNESLAIGDWGIDRDVYAYDTDVVPVSVMIGQLAESWTMPDDVTVVFTIRDNVFWRDRPPTNGRQLTAHDIVYNWNRYLGFEQFAEQGPSPSLGVSIAGIYESITATDDHTVVFKLAKPRLDPLYDILFQRSRAIYAPEVIEEHGDVQDWRHNVGTGPYDLVEWVEESVMVWNKIDDYWGFDEKYPDNRLPYVDELVALHMKEEATYTAALRTGQVDMLTVGGGIALATVEAVDAILKTNPDMQAVPFYSRALQVSGLNIRRPPFDDIRVRKAMNMAIDRDAINESYYGGYAYPTVQGWVGAALGEMHTPFAERSADLQAEYSYHPQEAERLLDEAGYARGADGVRFKVTYDHRDVIDLGWVEIVAGYWKAIGVEVEITVMDTGAWVDRRARGLYEMTTGDSGWDLSPAHIMSYYGYVHYYQGEGQANQAGEYTGGLKDATMSRLYEAFQAATSQEARIPIMREFDDYIMRQHFQVYGHKAPAFQLANPWVKGWNGETFLTDMSNNEVLVRVWIDQDLKAKMGF
jgi:peptide/nickel transport system substrate-binding protein